MLPQLMLYLIFVALSPDKVYGFCTVSRVTLRIPRENDIGLFFDITLSNKRTGKSEMVEFSVTSEGVCTLNTSRGEQVLAGNIFGGDFGSIEPGSSMTVSLVWPTVSLYNRVGSCPITVSTVNHENVANKSQQTLYFDTRFETLDPGNHSLTKRKDFVNCRNWDHNYFKNCTPLDCEELYFGKRSFYNCTSEQCEPVPVCFGNNVIYDFYANECIDRNNFLMDEDIELLKQGKYDDNFLDLEKHLALKMEKLHPNQKLMVKPKVNVNRYQHSGARTECNLDTKLSLVDFNNCFQHLNDPKETTFKHFSKHSKSDNNKRKTSPSSILKSFYYEWYLPLKAQSDDDNDNDNDSNEPTKSNDEDVKKENLETALSKGPKSPLHRLAECDYIERVSLLLQMLLIISLVLLLQVCITILAYTVVCLLLYGLMKIIIRIKPQATMNTTSRSDSDVAADLMTSASLMSQLK